MSTLATLPVPGLKSYVVHHRTPAGEEITRFRVARNQSSALADSGLPSGTIHDANRPCFVCTRALAAPEPVSS